MDCLVHEVTKNWTWLSDFHFLGSFHISFAWVNGVFVSVSLKLPSHLEIFQVVILQGFSLFSSLSPFGKHSHMHFVFLKLFHGCLVLSLLFPQSVCVCVCVCTCVCVRVCVCGWFCIVSVSSSLLISSSVVSNLVFFPYGMVFISDIRSFHF